MDQSTLYLAPSLPLWAQLGLTIVLTGALLWALRKMQDWSARIVCLAGWVRYIVASYHEYTFPSSPLGPSIASLSAMGVCALGIYVIRKRHLLLKSLIPLYLLMLVSVVSGLLAGDIGGVAASLTKLTYLMVVAVCMMEAIERNGDQILAPMIVGFFPPYLFQWVSIALNIPKAGERDGSASYIGGYGHEGAFSEMLIAAIIVAGLTRTLGKAFRLWIILAGISGVILANYRTTILAFAPFLILILIVEPLRNVRPALRAATLTFYAILIPILILIAGPSAFERFSDITQIPRILTLATTSPGDFNREEAQLMSGRALLWARYIEAANNGNTRQRLIGYGPEKRVPAMAAEQSKDVYAHNTLVSAIYEFGIIGLCAYLLFFAYMIVMALRASKESIPRVLTLAISMIILNMATMPMWQFEGIILTALFWGYAMQRERENRRATGQMQAFRPMDSLSPPRPIATPAMTAVPSSAIRTGN